MTKHIYQVPQIIFMLIKIIELSHFNECPHNPWFFISTEERIKRNAPNFLLRELECAESDNGLRCLDDCIMPEREHP